MQNLKIYEVNGKYINYLSQIQDHLFISDGSKRNRKYIGIVLVINNFKYFVPLSSFKDKHKTMKESVDFIKIRDYAVINLNNMVPVPESDFKLIDISIISDQSYKFLLQAEIREINKQKARIYKNAEIVYKHKIRFNNSTLLGKRTNDFKNLEKALISYKQQ